MRSPARALLALTALAALGCQQHDPAACGCRIDDDGALVMSWDCYCRNGGCDAVGCHRGPSYLACGLTVSVQGAITDIYVSDASGKQVGVQHTADIGFYSCPSDPSLTSGRMRAGQFPDPSCDEVSCACPIDGQQCQVAVDGGTSDGCDCRVANGVMTLSWDCYCKGGCNGRLSCSAGQQRTGVALHAPGSSLPTSAMSGTARRALQLLH